MYYELTCGGTDGVNRSYVKATEEEMAIFNHVLKSEIHCDWNWGGSLPVVTATFNNLEEMYSHIFRDEINILNDIELSVTDYAKIINETTTDTNNASNYFEDINSAIKHFGKDKTIEICHKLLNKINAGTV